MLPALLHVILKSAGQPGSHWSSPGLPGPSRALVIDLGNRRCRVGRVGTVFRVDHKQGKNYQQMTVGLGVRSIVNWEKKIQLQVNSVPPT
jgi:hypothetical protein